MTLRTVPVPIVLVLIEMITRSTIATAAASLFLDPGLDLADAIARHSNPSFRQHADGVWSDWAELAEHVAHPGGSRRADRSRFPRIWSTVRSTPSAIRSR